MTVMMAMDCVDEKHYVEDYTGSRQKAKVKRQKVRKALTMAI